MVLLRFEKSKVKVYTLLVTISMTINSCGTSIPKRQYFEYDEVIHYYLSEESEKKLNNIEIKEAKSNEEEFMLNLYHGKHNFQLSDSAEILNAIQLMNYNHQAISVEKLSKLKRIFRDRQLIEIHDYMCYREYRDVLVFKDRNTIKGIAFICFKCNQNEILGTQINTLDFGQKGNYEKLHKILYNK